MTKKMVILTQYFLPEMGAPQSRLYETAIGLKKLGWDVRIVTAMPNYPKGKIFKGYRGKIFIEDTVDSIPVYRYTLFASNSKKKLPRIASMLSFSMTSLLSFFRVRKFKPAYIFTESPPLTLALSGIIISKLTGARHVMNVSDIWPLSAYELGAVSDGFFYKTLQRLEKFLYRSSYACTGQSQEIVDYLRDKGSNKAHLYRNGVDTSRFHCQDRPSSENNKLRIVYTGLLGVAQGIAELCRNIDFASVGAEFHIYGEGAEKKEIQDFLERTGKEDIYLHEVVARTEVPAVLAQYDITLIPLIKPIFGAVPSKIYEAMAAGLPILFAGGGEGARLIQQHDTGWVCEPADYASMEKKIKEIAALDGDTLRSIQGKCTYASENFFDRNIQIEQLHHYLLEHETDHSSRREAKLREDCTAGA